MSWSLRPDPLEPALTFYPSPIDQYPATGHHMGTVRAVSQWSTSASHHSDDWTTPSEEQILPWDHTRFSVDLKKIR